MRLKRALPVRVVNSLTSGQNGVVRPGQLGVHLAISLGRAAGRQQCLTAQAFAAIGICEKPAGVTFMALRRGITSEANKRMFRSASS